MSQASFSVCFSFVLDLHLSAQPNWLLLHTHLFSSIILTVPGSTWLLPDPVAHWTEKIHLCCLYHYFSCLSSRICFFSTLAEKKDFRSLNLRQLSKCLFLSNKYSTFQNSWPYLHIWCQPSLKHFYQTISCHAFRDNHLRMLTKFTSYLKADFSYL